MLEDKAVFTPTMAKVLESQGYLKEAAQIYSHLLDQMPGHTVFQKRLAEIQRRLAENDDAEERLTALFEKWFSLAMARSRLERLKKLTSDRRRHGDETNT